MPWVTAHQKCVAVTLLCLMFPISQILQEHTDRWLPAAAPMPKSPGPAQTAWAQTQREAVDAMIHQVCVLLCLCVFQVAEMRGWQHTDLIAGEQMQATSELQPTNTHTHTPPTHTPQVQGEIASSRNEMSKLHASSHPQQQLLHGQSDDMQASSAPVAAAPVGPVVVPKLNLGGLQAGAWMEITVRELLCARTM